MQTNNFTSRGFCVCENLSFDFTQDSKKRVSSTFFAKQGEVNEKKSNLIAFLQILRIPKRSF